MPARLLDVTVLFSHGYAPGVLDATADFPTEQFTPKSVWQLVYEHFQIQLTHALDDEIGSLRVEAMVMLGPCFVMESLVT